MSTQINVSVDLEELRRLNQAQINANRQAQLLQALQQTQAQKAVDAQAQSLAAQGRDVRGQMLYGIRSDRQRPQPQPFAVYRQSATGPVIISDIGFWLVGAVNNDNVDFTYTGNLGALFKPASVFSIGYLGCYDGGADGIQKSMVLKLWRVGTSSAISTVTIAPGTGSIKVGAYRYAVMDAPVTVSTSDEYIVSVYYVSELDDPLQEDRYQFYPTGAPFEAVVAFNPSLIEYAFQAESNDDIDLMPNPATGSVPLISVNATFALEGTLTPSQTTPPWAT